MTGSAYCRFAQPFYMASYHGAFEAATECLMGVEATLYSRYADRVKYSPQKQYAGIVRCVFGNPYRPPQPVPSCQVAQAAARLCYDSRDFGALPIIADMIEDAGCSDSNILKHLRGPGPHCRGCWALDAVLGRRVYFHNAKAR